MLLWEFHILLPPFANIWHQFLPLTTPISDEFYLILKYIFSLLLADAYWNAQRTIMYQINCTHLVFFLIYVSQKYQRNNFRMSFPKSEKLNFSPDYHKTSAYETLRIWHLQKLDATSYGHHLNYVITWKLSKF